VEPRLICDYSVINLSRPSFTASPESPTMENRGLEIYTPDVEATPPVESK
jgi:hypothetical protein